MASVLPRPFRGLYRRLGLIVEKPAYVLEAAFLLRTILGGGVFPAESPSFPAPDSDNTAASMACLSGRQPLRLSIMTRRSTLLDSPLRVYRPIARGTNLRASRLISSCWASLATAGAFQIEKGF